MKKRMVFLAALALCAGLLCGCGDGSPASGTESTPAETSLPESQASLAGKDSSQDGEKSGPVESPPYLEVSSGDSGVQAARSTYSWMITNEDGSMYINAGSLDAELAGYINTVSNDEDVRLLKEETNQKMNEAMASDEKLNLVVEKLNEGANYTAEEPTEAETQPQDVSQMTFEDRDEDVLTTTTVRVRSTPSTDSDDNIIANVEPGETLHRTGYNAQWSRITYDGEEAYVSSDYVILK